MSAAPGPTLAFSARIASVPHARRRSKHAATAMALLLASAAGCSAPPPTLEEASHALLASKPFRSALIETVESSFTGRCAEAPNARPEWNRWLGLGLARTSEIATSSGPLCRLTLEETARLEAESWRHRASGEAGGERIILPVAVRSLIRISELRQAGRGVADAVFEWQWRPNGAGQRLGVDSSLHTGTAQLVLDDSGWRAGHIEFGNL